MFNAVNFFRFKKKKKVIISKLFPSFKLTEAAADFHLLQTKVRRKKEEVGSHERTLSKRSS